MSERDRDQSKQSAVDSLTFIVRLWPETDDTGRERWRGRVEHVASQQVRYVDNVADVSRVIERWTCGLERETGVENGEPIHTLRVEADSETGS